MVYSFTFPTLGIIIKSIEHLKLSCSLSCRIVGGGAWNMLGCTSCKSMSPWAEAPGAWWFDGKGIWRIARQMECWGGVGRARSGRRLRNRLSGL